MCASYTQTTNCNDDNKLSSDLSSCVFLIAASAQHWPLQLLGGCSISSALLPMEQRNMYDGKNAKSEFVIHCISLNRAVFPSYSPDSLLLFASVVL